MLNCNVIVQKYTYMLYIGILLFIYACVFFLAKSFNILVYIDKMALIKS